MGRTVQWGIGGILWGALILYASGVVVGGGHGWVSPLPFAILAVLTSPLSFIAWARRRTNGRVLAVIALAIGVISDVLLLIATLIEGTEYFQRVLSAAIVWILLWVSWQVLALFTIFSASRVNEGKPSLEN